MKSQFALLCSILQVLHAFPAANTLLGRLEGTQAELLVSVGRIPGTAMPPSWAESGARLAFPLEVEFTDETAEYAMTKENLLKGDALMGTRLRTVEALNEPQFVSANGIQTIAVEDGAYGCSLQSVESRQFALRFFMDFPEGAKRNDVELPAERVYFLSSCWLSPDDENALNRARKREEKLTQEIDLTEARIDKINSQELESNPIGNVIQRAFNLRHLTVLVERKNKLTQQLEEIKETYPVDPNLVIHGPNNIIYAKEGIIAVKRLKGAMGTREQYWWIGTFTIKQFFEDE